MCDADVSLQNTTSQLSLLDLPVEILLHICSFLDAASLVHGLSVVCKDFHMILNDDSMWKARISRIYPQSSYPVLPPAEEDELFWKLSCVAIERQFTLWGNEEQRTLENFRKSDVHYGTIDSILLLNEGKICISGGRDRSLVHWILPHEEHDGHVATVMDHAHGGWIWDLTALHDTVYSCSWDRTIKAWKLTAPALVHSSTYDMYMARWLVMFRSKMDGRVKRERNANITGALLCITSSQDLGLFAAGSYCKTVLLFDPRCEHSLIDRYTPHQRAIMQIEMNNNYIFSASEDKTVSIWDHRARKTLKTIKISKECFPMSMAVQKDIIYVGDNGGNLHVLDPNRDFKLVESYVTGHKKAITGVHRAPGCLITSSLDKTVRISSPTHPPRLLTTLRSRYGEVASMDYLNEVLAISGTDGTEVWRPPTYVSHYV